MQEQGKFYYTWIKRNILIMIINIDTILLLRYTLLEKC